LTDSLPGKPLSRDASDPHPNLLEFLERFSLPFPVHKVYHHTLLLEVNGGIFHQFFDSLARRKPNQDFFWT
jgi:hypothetical protein